MEKTIPIFKITGQRSFVVVVVPRNGTPDGGRVLADGRVVGGGRGPVGARPLRHAQPTDENDEQLKQDEGDQHQGQRVRVPVDGVPVLGRPVVHLPADVTPLRLELELVLDPDLLEHHLVRPVVAASAGASSATPPVTQWNLAMSLEYILWRGV